MRGYKPSHKIWTKVNAAILGENAADVLVTILSGLSMLLVESGMCKSEPQARAHLAAMLLSPDTSDQPGSLFPLLHAELQRLRDGKWII